MGAPYGIDFGDEYYRTPSWTGEGGYFNSPRSWEQLQSMMGQSAAPANTPSLSPYESQYLGLLKKSIPNPLLNAGLSFGTSMLGGLAGLLGGPSEQEKLLADQRRRGQETYALLKNRYAQSGNEPAQYLAQFMRATQEQRSREAETMNSRLGLDSGVAQGELLNSAWNSFLNYSLGAQERGTQRKDQLLMAMRGI